MARAALDFLSDLGRDRYLTPDESDRPGVDDALSRSAWNLYLGEFEGFTGSTIDPLFARLDPLLPASGRPVVPRGSSVVIVGTGPSFRSSIDGLRERRERLCLVTSMRGREALWREGLKADLVLVEHRTALDAELSASNAGRGEMAHQDEAAVAVAQNTPPRLLRHVAGPRTFWYPDAPSWGLWPATAVALALRHEVPAVALVGVDLGHGSGVSPEFSALGGLLTLLAQLPGATTRTVDCGSPSTSKGGWTRGTIEEIAVESKPGTLDIEWLPPRPRAESVARERAALTALSPLLEKARGWLEAAERIRAGRSWPPDERRLSDAAAAMAAWGRDPTLRATLLDTLGVSFLPRMWRCGVGTLEPSRLWRPVVLALRELVAQAGSLDARLPPA